jgi:mannonate dehydratase
MRNAWAINKATEEVLITSQQFGVKDLIVYGGPGSPWYFGTDSAHYKKRNTYEDYLALVKRVAKHGLRIEGVEGGFVHHPKYRDVAFGGPKRDELIEELIAEVRDIARAGIRIYGYHWMPNSVWRTLPVRIRGGAEATAFEYDQVKDAPFTHGRKYTRVELWKHLEYWIKAVTPVAEEEGIRLGIHPDDPPVKELGGLPRLLNSFDAYKKLISIVDSPSNAIEFCQGTFSEMNEDIYEMIDYFARRRKILYVHFRNVDTQVPTFREEFINTGYVDMRRAMRTYRDAGYDGVFMDDHCPLVHGDATFPGNVGGYRSRIFAQGYIQAMLEAVAKEQRDSQRARSPSPGGRGRG